MKKFLWSVLVLLMSVRLACADTFQVTNANFEDWSAAAFNGEPQPKGWNASNVEQVGMKFNFAHKETGRNGGYCMMVQDQEVGAMGITETSPGYFSIGKPWAYLPSITAINQATAGTSGGQSWTHRPDTMSVWIKRTGSNWDKEDFYLLYYAWVKEAQGTSYKGKNGSCTSHSETNEESDVRIAMNGNECKTTQAGEQVCEGMWRERKTYGQWTNIRVPIYYFNDNAPKFMNIIFSASNYPNFRANSGLYEGNSLYVDDVELIYSSKIQKLYVDGEVWNGFDPNSSAVQTYSLGESATSIPTIKAMRGAGSLTNAKGTTRAFPGRTLSGSEITIVNGDLVNKPTTITVKSEDGSSTTVYKIQFQKAASANAKLAGIAVNGEAVALFSPTKFTYNVELPYGTTAAPVVTADKQEEKQTVTITQATSPTGTATITVKAADNKTTQTYTLNFSVGKLADNTLQDILVNGVSVPGFTPSQTNYKVSLPEGTTTVPTIQAVSAYPAGAQTIEYVLPTAANLNGGSAQIKVTTPGNQTARIYKLTFKIEKSAYSYLRMIYLNGVELANFEPENLTYYVNLPLGTTTLPTITYDKGDVYQKTPVIETGGLDGTTRITVEAANGDKSVYKLIFSTEKSDRSTLNGIEIGGVALEGFSPDRTNYTYQLPVGATVLPEITAIPGDEFQTIVINKGTTSGTTRITVTAGNGSITIYLITFSVDAYTNNTLAGLSVAGQQLLNEQGEAVTFNPEVNDYWVNLPQGTNELPEVTVQKQDENLQTVTVRNGGLNGDYRITVRPQSGASRTYTIHFSVATSGNTKLANLSVEGYALAFDPDVREYHITLDEGVSQIPTVTYEKAEPKQRVLSVLEDTVQILTVTAESGAKAEYKIYFRIQLSANAFLQMIYLNGDSLEGFHPEVTNYTYQLAGSVVPTITVDKSAGQQVTITSPVGAGKAVILVVPEMGASQKYTITFTEVPAASVQLANILVDGVQLPGFLSTKKDYTYTYEKSLPTVTWETTDPSQTVQDLWQKDTLWLHVADTLGTTAMYNIVFTRHMTNNVTLASILADGVQIAGFAADKHHYSFDLAAGSTYPVLDYTKADETQSVVFGQAGEGRWSWLVTAENGDTATYTVQYTIARYADATLANLTAEGLSFVFDPTVHTYGPFVWDAGKDLPDLAITAKAGQTVMSYNLNDTAQQVLVMAENGTADSYTITYTRTQSSNAQLKAIYIDGAKLKGFDPDEYAYYQTLPQGTTVLPNIFPIGQVDNQTITTYMSRPNGITRIHVVAQDGTEQNYTIEFTVAKSGNAKLGSLSINGVEHSVDTLNYVLDVPFGAVEPYEVSYTKAEEAQFIHYTEAPIDGTTKIVVTSEDGASTRTYTVRYNVAEPEGENLIRKINYTYTDKSNAVKTGSITNPKKGDNEVKIPNGAKAFRVTGFEKKYPEQSVVFYEGSIRRSAKLLAVANREGEDDVEYTVTPVMEADTVGKLKSLTFNGVPVENFNPDVFNYIVKTTAQPAKTDFEGVAYGGAGVTSTGVDTKNKKISLKVSEGQTYTVTWYYLDGDPFDFSEEWIHATYNGYKPSNAWTIPGDCANDYEWGVGAIKMYYQTGSEVMSSGSNGVLLQTIHGSSLSGSVPGMMTTGNMTLSLGSSGGSSSSVSETATKGITFRNSPDSLSFWRKELASKNINSWSFRVRFSDGSSLSSATEFTGSYSNVGKSVYESKPVVKHSNVPQLLTATINACHTENASDLDKGLGGTIYTSALQLTDIHFVYNSELTAATVNGKSTTKNGNTFTYTLAANEVITGVPTLKFTGKVSDQAQVIEWLNGGEWKDGKLKARVINYGENLKDSTHYYVVLSRSAVTTTDYTIDFGSYPTSEAGDTTYVNLPYGTSTFPDVTVTPADPYQLFAISKKNNSITVKVTPEQGAAKTSVYVFRETKSGDATFENPIELQDKNGNDVIYTTVDPIHFIYQFSASEMANLVYEKRTTVHQYVDLQYTANAAILTVTAENGSTRTYTYNRVDPTVASDGTIESFEMDGNAVAGFGGAHYTKTADKLAFPAELVSFTRKFEQDSVVFIQTPAKMEWQVYGGSNHIYTWTYPTTVSAKADLADILVNGEHYEEFFPTNYDYSATPIYSTGVTRLTALPAEAAQKIEITQEFLLDGINYQMEVTAANQVAQKIYKLRVERRKSSDITLAGIWVDSVLIDGFNPATTSYTVTLPSPAVKTAEPQMPSISYIAGQSGQTISLIAGELNGEATTLTVTAEDGSSQDYNVTVNAAPSHCAELTGIMINGEALDGFEPGRRFYSIELMTDEVEIVTMADDRFQTVQIQKTGHNREIVVTAQDGTTTKEYTINIFVKGLSADATLSNILLATTDSLGAEHMVEIVDFMRDINPEAKKFDPFLNNYDINLPSGTTVLPAVSAQLKMPGQTVDVKMNGKMQILIDVTAQDGEKTNQYQLNFKTPKSSNANLSMLFINGDSLQGFTPDNYFYQVSLPEGVHTLPEVAGQKSEARQTLHDVQMDTDRMRAELEVVAEDESYSRKYVVVFEFTKSDADTLQMIFADGDTLRYTVNDTLRMFSPSVFFYSISLPVGTAAFPDLSWSEVNDLQTIELDTVAADANNLIRRIHVTAESLKKNTYIISYTILKSSVDTLQMIYIDDKPLEGFRPTKDEYFLTLSAEYANSLAGALPKIECLPADTLQTIMISQAPDSLSGKSLGYKSIISVTAPSGAMRIYTIHYLVETSHDASLNMIMLSGKPLTGFDSQKETYRLEWDARAALPVVTVAKKEEAQTYEMFVNGDSIQIVVVAEDGLEKMTYTLVFNRELSDDTRLQSIRLEGHPEFLYLFSPTEYVYDIQLPFGEDTLPHVEVILSDTMQLVPEVFPLDTLEDGTVTMTIPVTAPNHTDQDSYILRFHFGKNDDALLKAIYLNDTLLAGFNSYIDEYVYEHPFGTDSTKLFGVKDVRVELSDSLATDTIVVAEDGTIYITVIAHDGVTEKTYAILQKIGLDGDNYLSAIRLDSALINGFDPEITFYTYMVKEGQMPPIVTAEARSENARLGEVPVVQAGDTCEIVCTAANGAKRVYRIHFAISPIDPSMEPTSGDVLVKRLPGTMTLFAASIRSDVFFVLYDQYGQVVYMQESALPVADPNEVETATDPTRSGGEQLADVKPGTDNGVYIELHYGEIYMYAFYQGGKKLIKSGKLIAY
ncbi:MAG: hypothetical protein J5761_02590 [Paludibacteraceae bacterium]|nr:hypothetical protein [Paludibacteraceae bacterium]